MSAAADLQAPAAGLLPAALAEKLTDEQRQALAEAPRMREWWDLMEAMQIPHPRRQPGAWWAAMDEVFHQD